MIFNDFFVIISTTVTTWRSCDLVCWSNFRHGSHKISDGRTDWQMCSCVYEVVWNLIIRNYSWYRWLQKVIIPITKIMAKCLSSALYGPVLDRSVTLQSLVHNPLCAHDLYYPAHVAGPCDGPIPPSKAYKQLSKWVLFTDWILTFECCDYEHGSCVECLQMIHMSHCSCSKPNNIN
jgi:hypothetical protein